MFWWFGRPRIACLRSGSARGGPRWPRDSRLRYTSLSFIGPFIGEFMRHVPSRLRYTSLSCPCLLYRSFSLQIWPPQRRSEDGMHADLNETFLVGDVADENVALVRTAYKCLQVATNSVKVGSICSFVAPHILKCCSQMSTKKVL